MASTRYAFFALARLSRNVKNSENMQITGWKRWTLGAVGTIILGGLGSGLWDLVIKPSAARMAQVMLTAATLGSSVVKDGVYREAAKGLHEAGAWSCLDH